MAGQEDSGTAGRAKLTRRSRAKQRKESIMGVAQSNATSQGLCRKEAGMRKDEVSRGHCTMCYLSQDPSKSSATLFPKLQALSLRLLKPERASSSVEKSIGAASTMPLLHKSSLVLIAQS